MSELRVLHFNDCANVGQHYVEAARRAGHEWDYLPPGEVRPASLPTNSLRAKATWLPYLAKRRTALARADVVHVHYATSVPLIQQSGMPSRPYLLHLHGTDIREQWLAPATKPLIQSAIDGAAHVFYTNLDTTENATKARTDAEYVAAPVDLAALPQWTPPSQVGGRKRIVFASRWSLVKGAPDNIALATHLRSVLPEVELVGLDWGEVAEDAARAGVTLGQVRDHAGYLDLLAGADLVVGQARPILAVSEFEAMAIGAPVAALGTRLPRPDDGSTPPVIEGDFNSVLEAIVETIRDPAATAAALGGAEWVRAHHDPADAIEQLLTHYRAAVSG